MPSPVHRLAGILALGALTPLLDSTIVSTTLHALGRDLDASTATVMGVPPRLQGSGGG